MSFCIRGKSFIPVSRVAKLFPSFSGQSYSCIKGRTVERDAFNDDTQPWRARRPDEDG
jgi:hypothetical protein